MGEDFYVFFLVLKVFISDNFHIFSLNRNAQITFVEETETNYKHMINACFVYPMSGRYSTNWDRKGWPGSEIQMYYGCPWIIKKRDGTLATNSDLKNVYTSATWCRRPLIFQTVNSVKYPRFTRLGVGYTYNP